MLIAISILKYLFSFVVIGGIMAFLVYLFLDAQNKKLKKIGICLSLIGFSVVVLISLLEIYLF